MILRKYRKVNNTIKEVAMSKQYKVTVNYLDEPPPEWRWDAFNDMCVKALLRIAKGGEKKNEDTEDETSE